MSETTTGGPRRALVVEDEPPLANSIRRVLEREGFEVSVCETGARALKISETWRPDVVLLDLTLPDLDGRDIARELRRRSPVPIIMVTGRGEEQDRVVGLEIGADDYLVKPFSFPELVARVRAVLRRSGNGEQHGEEITFKDLRVNLGRYTAWKEDQQLRLTRKEFELLRMLMAQPGVLVRRDELVHGVWNMPLSMGMRTLDVHISSLRKKLGDDPKDPRYIETVSGLGYRLATE